MSLILDVSYSEKDIVKALGAKWNPTIKAWYVQDRSEYFKFSKWILKKLGAAEIICDHFYIAEGVQNCFRCHSKTTVIGIGIEKYLYFECQDDLSQDPYVEYHSDTIQIVRPATRFSADLFLHLEKNYNFKQGYSNVTKSSSYCNHCQTCGVIQGNFYVYHEVDSPFFIDSIKKASDLRLLRVPINHDVVIQTDIGYGSGDYLIAENAQIMDCPVSFNL